MRVIHALGLLAFGMALGALTDYSVQGANNRQFALNTVRWLMREL